MNTSQIVIPRSEIERQVLEDWLRDEMTRDVAVQGYYADVEMNFDGIATVIWNWYREGPSWDIDVAPVVLGIAWFDTQRNVACWECNATKDLLPQSNDVGFVGPDLPRVERREKLRCESN